MKINLIDNYEGKELKLSNALLFVQIDEQEAIALINSLSNQLRNKNPNCGRLESFCEGIEFSIAVISKKEIK